MAIWKEGVFPQAEEKLHFVDQCNATNVHTSIHNSYNLIGSYLGLSDFPLCKLKFLCQVKVGQKKKWKSDESSSIPVITCGVSSNDSVIWGKFKLIWTSKGLTRRSVSDKRIKVRICAFSCCNLAVAQNYWFTDFGSSQDWTGKLSNETAGYER